MLDFKNKKILTKEINKVKKQLENCTALITKSILEADLKYLESKL